MNDALRVVILVKLEALSEVEFVWTGKEKSTHPGQEVERSSPILPKLRVVNRSNHVIVELQLNSLTKLRLTLTNCN
jgi:hypothetical protein